jgi:hypothetical protein
MIVVKGLSFGRLADGTWGVFEEAGDEPPPELGFTGAAWKLIVAQAVKK